MRLSSLISAFFFMALLQAPADPIKPKNYSREVSKRLHLPPPNETKGKQMRDKIEAIVFPSFEFKGSLQEALSFFSQESKKHSCDGRSVGSFRIRHGENSKVKMDSHIDMNLKKVNALETINEICVQAEVVWNIGDHAIEIKNPGALLDKK